MADPKFPRVEWLGDLEAFQSPNYLPGAPHNLPPNATLPRLGTGPGLIGALPTDDTGRGNFAEIRDPHHYASIISLFYVVGTTAINFLSENVNLRNFLSIRNASTAAQNIYIDFGKAATTDSFLRLTPNQIVLFDAVVPQNDLYAIADAAGGVISFGYSTIGR